MVLIPLGRSVRHTATCPGSVRPVAVRSRQLRSRVPWRWPAASVRRSAHSRVSPRRGAESGTYRRDLIQTPVPADRSLGPHAPGGGSSRAPVRGGMNSVYNVPLQRTRGHDLSRGPRQRREIALTIPCQTLRAAEVVTSPWRQSQETTCRNNCKMQRRVPGIRRIDLAADGSRTDQAL
jgi:hypothetical protein